MFCIRKMKRTVCRDENCHSIGATSFCTKDCFKGIKERGKLDCDCGDDIKVYEWCWKKDSQNYMNMILSNNDREVLFYPIYSTGTAAIKGSIPLKPNMHHYWEIKMLSVLYGTDVMVGIGTSKMKVNDLKFSFCSLLGLDEESWGYSYHGNIQHNLLKLTYGPKFSLGSIVGVYIDMCAGTLEYYHNRKPLGIAFKGLKSKELYPILTSSAAQCAMKINCAISERSTLQLECLRCICKQPQIYAEYRKIPGLTQYYDRKYFWIVPKQEKISKPIDDLDVFQLEDNSDKNSDSDESLYCVN